MFGHHSSLLPPSSKIVKDKNDIIDSVASLNIEIVDYYRLNNTSAFIFCPTTRSNKLVHTSQSR
jgi:hypothetical protein